MWRATFRSLPTGTFAQRAKVPHGARIRLSVPSAELCRKFSIFGQGGPEGTPFNFFASAKKFFYSGGLRGSRGFGGEKNLERENSGRKKSTKRLSNEKIVQNGRTVRSARGLGGVFFQVFVKLFLQKTHQTRQIWISSPYSSFYIFDQNIYILY